MQPRTIKLLKRMTKLYNKSREVSGLKRRWQRQWKMFRNGCLSLSIGMTTVGLCSCDAHKEFPDTTMKVGHVVCTDGSVIAACDCEEQGKEPIAVVFYINNDDETEGYGYAVYLKDTSSEAFSDSIGVSQGTSANLTAYDGNLNTYALFASTACQSPIAQSVFALWKYGQSAYIPSVAQMRLLYQTKGNINPVLELLGGMPLPNNPDESWYWTSTEVSEQETAKAWLYSLASGAMQETPKTQAHKVRPIITINN